MRGLDIEIDEFTPCLRNTRTGDVVDTSYAKVNAKEVTGLKKKGWLFNWRHPSLKESEIYKLTLRDDSDIQGLIALESHPRDMAYHISLAESAPHNKGQEKLFEGVGGHLFAIAAKKSYDAGYGGFIYFEAKSQKLADYYAGRFGAMLMGRPHEYSMIIDEAAAIKILNAYTLD